MLQCASRESSPGHKHGSLVCCRYTTGALDGSVMSCLLVQSLLVKGACASMRVSQHESEALVVYWLRRQPHTPKVASSILARYIIVLREAGNAAADW